MITVGIDLSAEPGFTAVAAVRWAGAHAVVDEVVVDVGDAPLLTWMRHPDGHVGIDCAFGWPAPFVDLVTAHSAGTLTVPDTLPDRWRRRYVLRTTDRFVHDRTGLTPLSVAADRLGHAAIRLAALIARVGDGVDTALDGSGALSEVYPAGALRSWSLRSRGYKGTANADVRSALVDELLTAAPWLELGSHEAVVRRSDHALDAVLCALVARAVALGGTYPPPDRALARREGWIHLPTGGLSSLVTPAD